VLKNGGARPGDRLLLTKGLGTGVISTAIKKGVAKQEWIDAAVKSMTTLNKAAAEVVTSSVVSRRSSAKSQLDSCAEDHRRREAAEDRRPRADDDFPVHALTDITGFGLIGHLREMLLASENVSAKIHASRIPLLEGALECVSAAHIPAGLKANREFAECVVEYESAVPEHLQTLLFDPQTAGGLLISVEAASAKELTEAFQRAGVPTAAIGEVLPRSKPLIQVWT
jgi:selenide,water dikinase